jgi:hypothetical protein
MRKKTEVRKAKATVAARLVKKYKIKKNRGRTAKEDVAAGLRRMERFCCCFCCTQKKKAADGEMLLLLLYTQFTCFTSTKAQILTQTPQQRRKES